MEKDIERGLERANSQESEERKEGLIQLTNILQASGTLAYHQLSPMVQYCLGVLLKKIEETEAPDVELTNFVNAIKKYLSEHVELPTPDGLVIDWSDNGRVSKVRDQKSSKICWIIEAVAAVESAYMIQQDTEGICLNIQEVVDQFGIDNGEVETAFEYIQSNGLSPESEYRWTGRVRTKRRHVKDKSSWCMKIATYYTNANSPYDERLEVLNKQPFVGGILITPALRYLKKGEIYVAPTLDPRMQKLLLEQMLHFVLVVGWGKQKGTDKRYFKVKNSWGTTWADKGYGLVDEAAVLGLSYPIDPKKVNNS